MRRGYLYLALALALQASLLLASDWKVSERQTIRRTLAPGRVGQPFQLKVDNIDGSIQVVGYAGSEVQLVAHELVQAESEAKADLARREVRLLLSETPDGVEAYVDAPYRCRDGSINYRGPRHYGYRVCYDFEVQVPFSTNLFLRTINNGEIRVEKVAGDFDIENINGGIMMVDVAGSGRAYALNGRVEVRYSDNPARDSYFGSLNSDVVVYFASDLSADVRLKTFNGAIFTDFAVAALPSGTGAQERRGNRFIYRADKFSGVRIGSGGPEIKFDAFNGDIRILNKENQFRR